MKKCTKASPGLQVDGSRQPPELDPTDYEEEMADFTLSEDQEGEFLTVMWSIMRSMAEMGFSIDVCGQLFGEFNDAAQIDQTWCRIEPTHKNEQAGGSETEKASSP